MKSSGGRFFKIRPPLVETTVKLYPPAVFRGKVNMKKIKTMVMAYKAGEVYVVECFNDLAEIAGVKFGFGDKIRVVLGRDFDEREGIHWKFQEKYRHNTAARDWGRFGFSAEAIIDMAVEIIDTRTEKTIYKGSCTSTPWDLSADEYLIEHYGVKPSENARISMAARGSQGRRGRQLGYKGVKL